MDELEKQFAIEIAGVLEEVGNLLSKKNRDYENSFYQSLDKVKEKLEEKYMYCFWQRLQDKTNRLFGLIGNEDPEINIDKKIRSEIRDIAGYCILMINYIDKDWQKIKENAFKKKEKPNYSYTMNNVELTQKIFALRHELQNQFQFMDSEQIEKMLHIIINSIAKYEGIIIKD